MLQKNQDAQAFTETEITETLKASKAYQDIQQFRGKVSVSLDLNELRKDNDEQ